MNLLALRKRILNFRLTEAEYQALQKACQVKGARSVSDYARIVLLTPTRFDETRSITDEILRRLDDLEARVGVLTESLRSGAGR